MKAPYSSSFSSLSVLFYSVYILSVNVAASDPCAKIGGQTWVAPADIRACFTSFPVDPVIKANIIDVINKTMLFHTSTNYEILAPEPFTADVHENIPADLARISAQEYPSDYDLHIDLYRTFKRLNDGHCVWIDSCYDSLFFNFIPTPLVLLTASDGSQSVHIAPAAFDVALAEFPDEIDVWQNALPGKLKGQLASLSGAEVLAINGQDPFVAVDANALITGTYQGFGTRQNTFFSSYEITATGWTYIMGDFAQQSLPLSDQVSITLRFDNSSIPVTITLPYRSRFDSTSVPFTDSASFRQNNCVAINTTNGVDLNANTTLTPDVIRPLSAKTAKNIIVDATPNQDIILPPGLQPSVPALLASLRVAQFYLLEDGITGVLALGSFDDPSFNDFQAALLAGLTDLVRQGAKRLIVDVTNNSGGFICIAHFLHRTIIGPKNTTVPQAGLDTKARAGVLAQEIVKAIIADPAIDPDVELMYNPLQWRNAANVPFNATEDWLEPIVHLEINGHADIFSPRLGQECQPEEFVSTPPNVPLFAAENVAIVGNGRCGSSCATFSIPMVKEEGAKTVVVGGKNGAQQEYCGTVGGQSTTFPSIDTEIKTTHLKNNSLAPPDLLVNGVQGITWRLSFGVFDPNAPEEWQDHTPTLVLPLTVDNVNNPEAIWKDVAARLFT